MALPSKMVRAQDKRKLPHVDITRLPDKTPSCLDRLHLRHTYCSQCKGTINYRIWGVKNAPAIKNKEKPLNVRGFSLF